MAAIRMKERGLVAGCAALCDGFFHTGVPLDGVQGDIEATGAVDRPPP
jgi:hypothetical protein